MVSTVVYFSDGIQSPFFALFYVTLIEAAATFGTRGALICAGIIGVLSLAVEVADTTQALTEPRVLEDFLGTTPYLFLIAAITGALRDRISALADAAAALRAGQEATEREMVLAREVQLAQLPAEIPSEPGLEFAVIYKPAREVGGDLYDFFPISPGQLGVVVADVAGKGVPAALLVSSAKYAVRTYVSEDRPAMVRAVNRHVFSVTSEDSFVTMLYGVIDTVKVTWHEPADAPLGISPSTEFVERRIALKPGDTLVLYTDGVTDALASAGEGLNVFAQVLTRLGSAEMPVWREELLRTLEQPRRLDDITVVAVRIPPRAYEWVV